MTIARENVRFSAFLALKGTTMKSTKTVIAILTIILAPLAFLQSCAVSIGDAINETETDSPAVGVFASFIFLLAGIAGLATKKYRTGNIITGVLFLLTALSVFGTYDQIVENFPDLIAYGWLSLIAAIVYFIPSKEKAETEKSAPSVENAQTAPLPSADDLSAKLEKLFALKEKGILSQQEFDEQKAALLNKGE